MKKRIICLLFACIMLVTLLTSCFKEEGKTIAYDYDLGEVITIPNFEKHKVEFNLDTVQVNIDTALVQYAQEYVVSRGDSIYVDIDVYHVTMLEGGIDQKGEKIEALSKSNYLLSNVGYGSISKTIEADIFGAKIGDIVTKLYKDVNVITDFAEEYSEFNETPMYVDIKVMNRNVMLGDVVSVNYKGYRIDENGNKLKNDKGEDDIFDENDSSIFFVGSQLAVEEFEQSLVGMLVGEENKKDFYVTFPDDYSDEDLKGKKVLFTAYINDIYTAPVYDNAFVKAHYPDYDTTADFEDALRKEFILATVYEYILDNCKVHSYPQDKYDASMQALNDRAESFKEENGITIDDWIEYQYQMTREEYVKSNLKTELIYYRISQLYNLVPTEEQLASEKEKIISYYKDYFKNQNSEYTDDEALDRAKNLVNDLGYEYLYENVMFTLVDEKLISEAEVTDLQRTYESVSEVIARGEKPQDK
ncbi:MAG: FKBP-type peptidyl-prolyl cis-trans isomerase [Clostridia bacterium]|nr:FKBP-type peptidyl-prolyl cis-trans isomerase [Clostridia bacterium]